VRWIAVVVASVAGSLGAVAFDGTCSGRGSYSSGGVAMQRHCLPPGGRPRRRACRVAIAVGVLLVAFAPPGLCAEPPSDDGTAGTLLRGLDARLSHLRTLQGSCTVTASYSQAYALSAGRILKQNEGLTYRRKDLQRLLFWVDFVEQKWDVQVIELISAGYDPLAVVGDFGVAESEQGGVQPWRRPQMRSTCDGEVHTLLRSGSRQPSACYIQLCDPDQANRGILHQLKFYLLLTIGNIPPGTYVRDRWAAPKVSASEPLLGRECYELGDEHLVDVGPTRGAIWVSPEVGFSLVKRDDLGVEWPSLRTGYRRVMEARSIQAFPDGLWLPTETVQHVYIYAQGRQDSWGYTRLCRFTDLRVNDEIDWHPVNAAPPLGTTVYDLRVGGTPRVHGAVDDALRAFESGSLDVPAYDLDAAEPLTGHEFDHLR
jgi:hypothetical protein